MVLVSARTATSWQTSLADLSLILFMLLAAALAQCPVPPKPVPAKSVPQEPAAAEADGPSAQAEPMAVYIAAPGAPPLARWLESQPRDPRQQLTVTVAYGPGGQAKALETAAGLLQGQGGAPGDGRETARIVIEPGTGAGVAPPRAVLAFDAPPQEDDPSRMARSLRRPAEDSSHGP